MFNSDPNNPDSLIEDITEVGLLTAGAPLLGKASRYYNENLADTFSNWGTKLPGSDYLVNQMNKTINTTSGQLLSIEGQSLSKTMLSMLMTAEEMSPLHILRTLQLSNLIQPFVELEQSNEIIHLTGRQIRGQEAYYKALLDYAQTENKNKVKRQLLVKDLSKGMFYHKGNIYGATKTGTIDKNDLILRDARLVLGSQTNGEIHSANHILEKFSNLIGGKLNKRELRSNPLTIVAGSSNKQFGLDWTKSTLRFAAEVGFKTLDNPVAGIEEMLHGVGVNYTGLFENKYYKAFKNKVNLGFGTNGNYDLGIRESLKISAKNIALKGAGLYIGYELLDSTLRTISGDNGLFSKGLATGLTNIYAEGRVGFAKLWSDRFQGYKERQEQNAPGSTNLTTLMAFPLAGALLGAQASYFGRVGVSSVKGVEKAASIYNVEKSSSLLTKIGIDAELKPMKRNALIGGLFGAALTIPFLPGALIGTSSKELEELYSGKKEIAEKSNRYWIMGGQCMPSSQPVYTRLGVKEAKDVVIGDEFLDRNGNYNKVTKLFEREVDEAIFNIKVSGAKYLNNKFTGNHPILTTEGWVEAKDIKKDDVLIAPKFKVANNKVLDLKGLLYNTECVEDEIFNLQKDRLGRVIRNTRNSISRYLDLTPQLGLIFGWFLAEGTVSQGSLTEFTFHSSEVGFATICAEYLKDTFGCNYTLERKKGDTYRLRISYVFLAKILKIFFYNFFEDSFKKFPDLSNTNEEFIKNFVIGLYYGDGDLSKNSKTQLRSKIRLTTSKLDHVLGLKNLLTYWEIYPYVLKEEGFSSFPNGTSGTYTSYRIVSEGLNGYKLSKNIGVYKELHSYEGKIPKLTPNPNYWFDEDNLYIKVIENTEEHYSGLVHDFTIENSHEFQVTSFIVHNSWEGGNTKFFTKSLVARMNADATDKVRYGDDDTKKAMNPFLHPFSYLKDPYQFEKRNAETMPYPIWGMDVSYGGIFGKVFEKTIGQVIKPDRVNPAVFDTYETSYIQEKSPNLLSKLFHARSEAGQGLNKFFLKELNQLADTEESPINKNLNVRERSLVSDGLMLNPSEGQYNPYKEASTLTFRSAMDFTGIKGWTSTLMLDSVGLDPGSVENQLARSGEANSMARDLVNQNLGDLLGAGEFQRKILPTSSGALPDRINPIKNTSSPDWMPSDPSKFYLDFSTGNYYSKVARGEERLAGVGFEALNPELQGVDPNDYSLVWRNKILTDVARGSKEHRETREEALQAYKEGDLSKREIEILGTSLDQEQQLSQKKDFYERPNTGLTGPIGIFQSLMWETMRRNAESPLEMLTPIRPAAKFLHQRTAIEDYMETQLGGSDAGIWTNPYSHFIKPALNKSRQSIPLGNEVFIPDEAREKYNIDEYFDKLDYLRKRKSGSNDYALSTVIGASMSGLNTKEKVLKFKAGLSDDQKDYFESFSKETNEGKRALIRTMLPEDVRRGYEQIWQNLDIANKARENKSSVQEAIYENFHSQTDRLKSTYDVDLSKEDKNKARKIVSQDKDTYSQMGMSKSERIQATEDELLRFKMADKEALTYIKQRTGVPNKNFIGWDPRLQTDDIKIRTLTLGGEDLKRFGFWKKDEERLRSLSAITEESDAVFSQINAIKADMKSNRNLKRSIERTMFENGFKATNIQFVDSDYGSILVREN